MPTDEYWIKRFEQQVTDAFLINDKSVVELKQMFKIASDEIGSKIQSFYTKYGIIDSSPVFKTLPDGTKLMTGMSKKLIVTPADAKKITRGKRRLTVLLNQTNEVIFNLAHVQNDLMITSLTKIGTQTYYNTIYEVYNGLKVGTSFKLLNNEAIAQIIKNPINGLNFSSRVWNNRDLLASRVNQEIKNGIIQGLSNHEMAKRVDKKMNSGFKNAKRLIDTETSNTLNQGTLTGYENSKVVKKYQYLATLDERTSNVCSSLDMEVFKIPDGVTGLNYPPMHVNCRSTTRAYFDKTYEEMTTRIARDEYGQHFTVPGKMTSKDFKNIYVDKSITRDNWDKINL